jgi:hypothetical protein
MLAVSALSNADLLGLPVQEVERDCASACAALSMPMPLAVSLKGGDISRIPAQLLAVLRQPESAIPLTPSLKASLRQGIILHVSHIPSTIQSRMCLHEITFLCFSTLICI